MYAWPGLGVPSVGSLMVGRGVPEIGFQEVAGRFRTPIGGIEMLFPVRMMSAPACCDDDGVTTVMPPVPAKMTWPPVTLSTGGSAPDPDEFKTSPCAPPFWLIVTGAFCVCGVLSLSVANSSWASRSAPTGLTCCWVVSGSVVTGITPSQDSLRRRMACCPKKNMLDIPHNGITHRTFSKALFQATGYLATINSRQDPSTPAGLVHTRLYRRRACLLPILPLNTARSQATPATESATTGLSGRARALPMKSRAEESDGS